MRSESMERLMWTDGRDVNREEETCPRSHSRLSYTKT